MSILVNTHPHRKNQRIAQGLGDKNPTHPSALALKDLTVGRHIIKFSCALGVMDEGRIIRAPYLQTFAPNTNMARVYPLGLLVIDVLSMEVGKVVSYTLDEMGVIPFFVRNSVKRVWSNAIFTIDARKRHLLPAPNPAAFLDELDEWQGWEAYEEA